MSRLAGTIDGMIGVDTHRDTLLPLSPLRQPAGPAGKVAGAPHDRSGAALHRPGRIQLLAAEAAEAAELGAELSCLVASIAPWLLELPGVGPVSAAQVLVRWSHACQLRSEAAFARPGRHEPDPGLLWAGHQASAEQLGCRQLNRALHRGGGPAAR